MIGVLIPVMFLAPPVVAVLILGVAHWRFYRKHGYLG